MMNTVSSRFRRRQAVVLDPNEKRDIAKSLTDPDCDYVLALELHLRKPISLSQLTNETHFTRKELKSLYRTFKDSTPSGSAIIQRDVIRSLFTTLFRGDTEHYADLIFETFDNDNSGSITFDKFVKALSTLCRGDLDERLEWLYTLYDPQNSGSISWHRLLHVITAMNDLTGAGDNGHGDLVERQKRSGSTKSALMPRRSLFGGSPVEHANYIFNKFDPAQSGVIFKQQFMEICLSDKTIRDSLINFDNV